MMEEKIENDVCQRILNLSQPYVFIIGCSSFSSPHRNFSLVEDSSTLRS